MQDINVFQANSPRSRDLRNILDNWNERILDFDFAYVNEDQPYPTKPGTPEFYIGDTNEKAYQRAFFQKDNIQVDNYLEFTPLDMEIPVFRGENPRRPSLDMIGLSKESTLVLSELKIASGTSPVWGIWELIKYAKSIIENRKHLSTHSGFKFEDKSISIKSNYWLDDTRLSHLLLAAPPDYWEKWRPYLERFQQLGDSLVARYKLNSVLQFVQYPEIDFLGQKGDKAKYWPKTEIVKWGLVKYADINSPRG